MDKEFTFDSQRPDEEVTLYRHQHPWVLAKAGFIDVALALVLLVVYLIWGLGNFSIWVFITALIVGGSYSFNLLFLYKNTFFILTDQRIINITQANVFNRKVQETDLVNIYNLTYSNNGVIKNLLNFGEIELTTQGHLDVQVILKNIPIPQEIFEKISKMRKKAVEALSPEERTILR